MPRSTPLYLRKSGPVYILAAFASIGVVGGSPASFNFAFGPFSLSLSSSQETATRGCTPDASSALRLGRFGPSALCMRRIFCSAGKPPSGGLSGVATNAHSMLEVVVSS
eukprot:7154263-Prymnesium_polylepis.1